MKKITTLFYALAILLLFILITSCNHSKNEPETGETADNDADTGKKELPECSPESRTPCKDSLSGLVWSAKSHGVMYAHDASSYCLNLSEDGFSGWRLPSIDELRTLIRNCWKTYTGGECRVSLEECRESSCEDDACAGCSSDLSGKYSKLGDNEILWSASAPPDFTDCSWIIDFGDGGIKIDSSYWDFRTRCVRDASNEDSGAGENSGLDKVCIKFDGKIWSNRVISIWSDAVDYCENLTECGISDWHLPTIDELRTLVRGGTVAETGGTCGVAESCLSYEDCYDYDSCGTIVSSIESNGRYNEFGDTNWFWSSSAPPDKPNSAWGVNFYHGNLNAYDKEHYTTDGCNVRCVSKGKDKDPDGCASGEYKCLHSQSLRCKDGFWIPDEFCEENGCDSSTGKCNGPECAPGEYRCRHYEESIFDDEYEYHCLSGHWEIYKTCEGKCNPSTNRCNDLCYELDDRTWSSTMKLVNWEDALDYCNNLTECGYSDWHMPSISELRTLIMGCSGTESGGECKVTDDCLSSGNCMNDACNGCTRNDSNDNFCRIGFEGRPLWSSSTDSDTSGKVWAVDFYRANVTTNDKTSVIPNAFRCVR
ncbi:DUF1566 domain-containing protein [bacterium]|nr:DUF1566 domain-containing protein [bacterium]